MQTAVVVHLCVERAARQKAPAKLLNENVQALRLAPWLHLADIELGRCANVSWQDLPAAEKNVKVERAAVAIRMGDPLALAAAAEHAAARVNAMVGNDVPPSSTVRGIVAGAVRTALSHLAGHIGGRA